MAKGLGIGTSKLLKCWILASKLGEKKRERKRADTLGEHREVNREEV